MKKLLLALLSFLLSFPVVLGFDVNVTVDVTAYVPPRPIYYTMLVSVGTITLGAGFILWVGRSFIGSPEDYKDLIELSVLSTIIAILAVYAIGVLLAL